MGREEAIEIVTKYVNQALNGQIIENPKVDLKAEWYDLSEINGLNEFLKDSCSIANTPGPDGFIIIGIDEKKIIQNKVSFVDSKLKDSNELIGIINKKIDRAFDINYIETSINSVPIAIFHIPPSFDKPHVIRNYKKKDKKGNVKENLHRIFIRSDSTTRIATKFDIERMIFDRKNIQPEYSFDVYINRLHFENRIHEKIRQTTLLATLCIENSGRRPASICELVLKVEFAFNTFTFNNCLSEYDSHGTTFREPIKNRNIIVRSNDIWLKAISAHHNFSIEGKTLNEAMEKGGIKNIDAELILNTGKKIIKSCKLLFN